MIDNSTKDKLENETPHFGNTLLYAVADLKRYSTIVVDPPWKIGSIKHTGRKGHKIKPMLRVKHTVGTLSSEPTIAVLSPV